jgi:hypothetical protein
VARVRSYGPFEEERLGRITFAKNLDVPSGSRLYVLSSSLSLLY